MSYEIDYSSLEGKEKREKAVRDVEFWLSGTTAMDTLRKYFLEGCSYQQFEFACSFIGIQGYPVRALWEHFIEEDEKDA